MTTTLAHLCLIAYAGGHHDDGSLLHTFEHAGVSEFARQLVRLIFRHLELSAVVAIALAVGGWLLLRRIFRKWPNPFRTNRRPRL